MTWSSSNDRELIAAFRKLYGRLNRSIFVQLMLMAILVVVAGAAGSALLLGAGIGVGICTVVLICFTGDVEQPRHDDQTHWAWAVSRYLKR